MKNCGTTFFPSARDDLLPLPETDVFNNSIPEEIRANIIKRAKMEWLV